MTRDFHESILHENKTKNLLDSIHAETNESSKCGATHQSPAEMPLSSVQVGASGPIPTHIDVVHQSVAVQKALPCREAGVRECTVPRATH